MNRSYITPLKQHFSEHSQMAILSGPRQVGKTTLALALADKKDTFYFNWDDFDDRVVLIEGGNAIANHVGLDRIRTNLPLIIFDEVHKYKNWKQLLKGFYDHYKSQCLILVTGSARMDVYKKGGDSLMGRYFHYRLHPFSVNELLQRDWEPLEPLDDLQVLQAPKRLDDEDYAALLQWGGFPDPMIKRDKRFFNRWSQLREQQLLREDIRELTHVQELAQIEMLAILLKSQAGQLTSYASLAKKVRVSESTVRRWIVILEALYYCFPIRPWTKNITRSLLKEPKYYLWDWSQCQDKGARNENFIASHLLKAVHYWSDLGIGNFALNYLRDKDKREVDFLVSRDGKPWFMVEVKSSMHDKLSPNLDVFTRQLDIPHIFQVGIDGEFVDKDVFSINRPVIVPARTFLSQLV